eukprot:TRINITY_DN33_c0_g1_i14.p2 TRINITY_DN33_c0_g1~~TRINITY_DN33_c0_g1_i14.p2  ORF type:complete len:188 (-),score=29.28 TRINITY_DN33_c0_g1_i14:118-681(-)
MSALLKFAPSTHTKIAGEVACADGSQCPEGSTCCQTQSGGYGCCPYPNADCCSDKEHCCPGGCCPYPNADCCSDKEHCCPGGYQCDVSAGTCTKQSSADVVPMLKKFAASTHTKSAGEVACADGSQCPEGSTCCQTQSGGYGCCPYPNADCCSDKEHCCPGGYQCDVSAGTCTKQSSMPVQLTIVQK